MRSENDSTPIRVILVEDDVTFQQALRHTFTTATDMQLVAVLSTRLQGLNILEQAPVDVLLVDLGLPDGSGIDVIRAAHAKWPDCNIMVSTAFGDEMHVMQSLEAGRRVTCLKTAAPPALPPKFAACTRAAARSAR
jgi:DNA-binding NarL/FixJ family response regulator